jgi:hypothetical protein
MFIFTTKFNKKKAVLAVLVLAAILIAIILIAGSADSANNSKETAVLSAVVKNNDQRVKYLNSLGWEVEKKAIEEQKVIIPRDFSDVYKKYNEIQISQGFDLSKYGGIEATRYTYKVLNYPDCDSNVVADILIYRNQVIAGDVQSNALDGFMFGLRYPQPSASPSPQAAIPTAGAANEANPEDASQSATELDENAGAQQQDALTSDTLASDEEAPEIEAP